MSNVIKKVIRASAGTGKTYRLSLEYIALLLRFRTKGIHFSEILVITFTKKATAEIRERIFKHLHELCNNSQDKAAQELCANLESFGIKISPLEIDYLRSVYREMLKNKDQVQISTIDSFTNMLFRSMIAPYLGLANYEIDEEIKKQNLAEISAALLQNSEQLGLIKRFLQQGARRNIQMYQQLIRSIVEKRWIFHFIANSGVRRPSDTLADHLLLELYGEFSRIYLQVLDRFQLYLDSEALSFSAKTALKKEFVQILFQDNADSADWIANFRETVQDPRKAEPLFKLIVKKNHFWNGGKLLRKKQHADIKIALFEALEKAATALGDYLLFARAFPEETILFALADFIQVKYDEIKWRDKIFTHADISYYTFRYLYEPGLSLIDKDRVTNAFYEYLTSRIRFVLIDEFQDTSILQLKIVQPIINEVTSGIGAKPYGGVIVVGDEKQSIYGWRGGERDLLLRMPEILQEADVSSLDVSYRSSALLIDFFNHLFVDPELHRSLADRGVEWVYQPIRPCNTEKAGCLDVHLCGSGRSADQESKAQVVRDYVQRLLAPQIADPGIAGETVVLARKNSDLESIAAVLDEERIDYVLESSRSLLAHRIVRPLMCLFDFLVYRQAIDLLRFLRSDAVLLDSESLRLFLLAYREQTESGFLKSWSEFLHTIKDLPFISVVIGILDDYNAFFAESKAREPKRSLLSFVHFVVKQLGLVDLFDQENDIKNLHAFLERVAVFEQTAVDYPPNLQGFLLYGQENSKRAELQQQGLESAQMVQLMTIHKAKGLEFDHVFLYLDLSTGAQSESGQLNSYLLYDRLYRQVEDYLLTFHYDWIVPACGKKLLHEEAQRRRTIEALNTLYVAMTRAKSTLTLMATVGHMDLQKWLEEEKADERPEALLVRRLLNLLNKDGSVIRQDDSYFHCRRGKRLSPSSLKITDKETDKTGLGIDRYIDFDRHRLRLPLSERLGRENLLDYHGARQINLNAIRGNVIHYYLSFIRHDSTHARERAAGRTLCFYGNLLPVEEINRLIARVDGFIDENADYFCADQWPMVFTEWTLFDSKGSEVRLDRLMVNPDRKAVLIIDFKTGEHHDPEQLEHYLRIIRSLDVVHEKGYRCEGRFVEIRG
ncbi:UvrD-helicase domain-containing protein [candidate division KSB1 bacterium]|nr:UvrD-helicase domain-containing protein [candidate division KSB1 bacterium]